MLLQYNPYKPYHRSPYSSHMLPKEDKETKCLCLIHPLRIHTVIIKYMSMRKYRNTVYGDERWCTFNNTLFKIHVTNIVVDPLPCVNLSNHL